jgi:hypothetical protein
MPSGGVEVRVTGAEQLRSLARDLKEAGGPARGLRRELLAAMRLAGKPLVDAPKASARAELPKAGGLNTWVADGAKISVRNRVAATNTVGMRIVATKGNHDLEDMDTGQIRHPVFGKWRRNTPTQEIYQGWFTKPLNAALPMVQAEVLMAMDIIGRRIEKGIF